MLQLDFEGEGRQVVECKYPARLVFIILVYIFFHYPPGGGKTVAY